MTRISITRRGGRIPPAHTAEMSVISGKYGLSMTLISTYQFEMYQLSFHFAYVYGGVVKWDL